MKKVSLHTFSIFMAFLVLFSTMSFTVEKHFCGKSLVGHGVFSEAEKCKGESHICGVEGMLHKKKKDSCCSDQTENIQGQDELSYSTVTFTLLPQFFIAPLSLVLIDLLPELLPEPVPNPLYEPPQLVYDVQILCQVFII